jgi:hypothetical protein
LRHNVGEQVVGDRIEQRAALVQHPLTSVRGTDINPREGRSTPST